jgi:hypothetical protein
MPAETHQTFPVLCEKCRTAGDDALETGTEAAAVGVGSRLLAERPLPFYEYPIPPVHILQNVDAPEYCMTPALMTPARSRTAVGYYTTSSATNVGPDKDSLRRQQDAVQAYAAANGLRVMQEFYDAAVSGADPVMEREGFDAMLAYMLGNGARIVLVENASRFARDLVVRITGHSLLKEHGV